MRNHLQRTPSGGMLAGPARFSEDFDRFNDELPQIARRIGFTPEEVGGFTDYRTFLWCVAEFLKSRPSTEA